MKWKRPGILSISSSISRAFPVDRACSRPELPLRGLSGCILKLPPPKNSVSLFSAAKRPRAGLSDYRFHFGNFFSGHGNSARSRATPERHEPRCLQPSAPLQCVRQSDPLSIPKVFVFSGARRELGTSRSRLFTRCAVSLRFTAAEAGNRRLCLVS